MQDFIDKLEKSENLSNDWLQSLTFSQVFLSIYKLEFNLKEKTDFSNLLQSTQNEDIDTMIKTTNYLKKNLIGTLFTFELMHDKLLIYGILFNIAKFKMLVNYLKSLLSEYNTKVTIFTNSK